MNVSDPLIMLRQISVETFFCFVCLILPWTDMKMLSHFVYHLYNVIVNSSGWIASQSKLMGYRTLVVSFWFCRRNSEKSTKTIQVVQIGKKSNSVTWRSYEKLWRLCFVRNAVGLGEVRGTDRVRFQKYILPFTNRRCCKMRPGNLILADWIESKPLETNLQLSA